MGRTWGTGLVVTAGLLGAGGCKSTTRPTLFQRNHPESEACQPGMGMPMNEGPMLGEMPAMTPGMTAVPGTMPPGTVTIPGPGMTIPQVTPAPNPPVGPPPRTAPSLNPTQLPGKPTT